MSILVTGAAGYIGSVTAAWLREQGEQIVILDKLSRGRFGSGGNHARRRRVTT